MENYKLWVLGVFGSLSVASFIISIVTLCSFEAYTPDKTSILLSGFSFVIAALAIIVTILIGWQLFSLLNINQIRKETIAAKDELLHESHKALFTTFQGLACFYQEQYIEHSEDDDLNKITVLYFGALKHWALTILFSVKVNSVESFSNSVKSTLNIAEDGLLSNKSKKQILDILSEIPDGWKTEDFNSLIKVLSTFQNDEED